MGWEWGEGGEGWWEQSHKGNVVEGKNGMWMRRLERPYKSLLI